MGNLKVIFTNNALNKMRQLCLSEASVMEAFNNGNTERPSFGGYNAIRKLPGREIGVHYDRNQTGEGVIISVWMRNRR